VSEKFVPSPDQPPLDSIFTLVSKAGITDQDVDEFTKDWQTNNGDFDNLLIANIEEEE